jgi:hypothetical protein
VPAPGGPYSYDLLDNLGRRSPRELTPGLEDLEVGQRIMTIFHLASFEPAIPPHGGLLGAAYRRVMPWFDLMMMRKQFLTLKRLAEETAAFPLDPTGA